MEKRTATHSRILAWRIQRTEEPDGLHSTGSHTGTRLKQLSTRARKPMKFRTSFSSWPRPRPGRKTHSFLTATSAHPPLTTRGRCGHRISALPALRWSGEAAAPTRRLAHAQQRLRRQTRTRSGSGREEKPPRASPERLFSLFSRPSNLRLYLGRN